MASGMAGVAPASKRMQIVQTAREAGQAATGKPYTFGGKSTSGFDCSGFVAYVYQQVFPEYVYIDTAGIRCNGRFTEVQAAAPGDLVFFPKGKNPYEVKKKNLREFPDHVGIVIDANTWIGSQTSTGVAEVHFSNPWWNARQRIFLRYTGLPST